MNPTYMDVPQPDNTIDSELPNWVCFPEDDYSHLTTHTYDENGIGGCSKHPMSGGCSIPQDSLANLIAQAANKAQADILIWATGGIKEFTEEGKIAIPAKIKELLSLTAEKGSNNG